MDVAAAAARSALETHLRALESLGSAAFVTQWRLPDETIGISLVAPPALTSESLQAVVFVRRDGETWEIEGWLESDDDRQIGPTLAVRPAWPDASIKASDLANRLANMLVAQFMVLQVPTTTVTTTVLPLRIAKHDRLPDWFVLRSRAADPTAELIYRSIGVLQSSHTAREGQELHYGISLQPGLPLFATLPPWMIADGRSWSRTRKSK